MDKKVKDVLDRSWPNKRNWFIKLITKNDAELIKTLPDLNEIVDKSLFICGDIETGKTVLAERLMIEHYKNWLYDVRVINQVIEQKTPMPTYLSSSLFEFYLELRSTFHKTDITEKEIIDKYVYVDVLILDDIAVEKSSEWAYSSLYWIINQRMQKNKLTIITSNYTLEELMEKGYLDARIVRRIKKSYDFVVKQHWDK